MIVLNSYKMDLDLWDCYGSKKTQSYNLRNTFFFGGGGGVIKNFSEKKEKKISQNYPYFSFLSGALVTTCFNNRLNFHDPRSL